MKNLILMWVLSTIFYGCALSPEQLKINHDWFVGNLDNGCFVDTEKYKRDCYHFYEEMPNGYGFRDAEHIQALRMNISKRYEHFHAVHYMSSDTFDQAMHVSQWLLRDGKTRLVLAISPSYSMMQKLIRKKGMSHAKALIKTRRDAKLYYMFKDKKKLETKDILYGKEPLKFNKEELSYIKKMIAVMNNNVNYGASRLRQSQKDESAYWGKYYAERRAWKKENDAQFAQMMAPYYRQSALSGAQGTINVMANPSGGYDAVPFSSTESFLKSSGAQAVKPIDTVSKSNTSKETHDNLKTENVGSQKITARKKQNKATPLAEIARTKKQELPNKKVDNLTTHVFSGDSEFYYPREQSLRTAHLDATQKGSEKCGGSFYTEVSLLENGCKAPNSDNNYRCWAKYKVVCHTVRCEKSYCGTAVY